jgi:predicted TIM-barrel fold metal-dependent hydrolase
MDERTLADVARDLYAMVDHLGHADVSYGGGSLKSALADLAAEVDMWAEVTGATE